MKITKKIDDTFETYSWPIYFYSLLILHTIYVLIFFGLFNINKIFINYLNIFIQTFICIFLLVRFHPFRKHELRENDSKIIFGTAIILLTNLGFVQYGYYIADKLTAKNPTLNSIVNRLNVNTNNSDKTATTTPTTSTNAIPTDTTQPQIQPNKTI
jgi:hypothetical protein